MSESDFWLGLMFWLVIIGGFGLALLLALLPHDDAKRKGPQL